MATLKTLKLTEIAVPERLRAVDEDQALAIQTSIVAHGLINPITVRHIPASKGRKYELVAGAHRLRAFEQLDEEEIEAIVVQADKLDAVLLEIQENLFRNDLSKLDRAIFVHKYREVWEEKHGKINPAGGRPKNSANFAEFPGEIIAAEAANGFSVHCAERLGLSERSIRIANQIATNIPPSLRAKLRGTPAEDNQSLLLKFAALPPEVVATAAQAIDLAEGDPVRALELLHPPAKKPSEAMKISGRLFDTWSRTNRKIRFQFLDEVGDEVVAAMFQDRARARRLLEPHRAEIEALLSETDTGA